MEHDVAFTGGNWRVVFDAHVTNPAKAKLDFVSWQVGWTPKVMPVHGGGSWNMNLRGGRLAAVPGEEVAMHFGPIIRLSSKVRHRFQTNTHFL